MRQRSNKTNPVATNCSDRTITKEKTMTRNRNRSVRLGFESLESREMLSANPIITAHHSPAQVQHTAQVDIIYYGPSWAGDQAGVRSSINDALKSILGSSYLQTLESAGYGEYDSAYSGATTTSSVASASADNVVTDAQVQNYLSFALHHPF